MKRCRSCARQIPWRLLLGFLIAPLAPGIILASVVIILAAGVGMGSWALLQAAALAIIAGAFIGYPVALVLGVPLHRLLAAFQCRGRLTHRRGKIVEL